MMTITETFNTNILSAIGDIELPKNKASHSITDIGSMANLNTQDCRCSGTCPRVC